MKQRLHLVVAGRVQGVCYRMCAADLGLKLGDRLTQRAVDQIPGRALVEVNKRIGARLLVQAGQRVVLKYPRAVPVLGGMVGGSLDALVCRKVGGTAKTLFRPPSGAVLRIVPSHRP